MTPEVLRRLKQQLVNRHLHVGPGLQNPHPLIPVDADDLQSLIDGFEHFRDEFHHHAGPMDCDCVELHDKWVRGEIK